MSYDMTYMLNCPELVYFVVAYLSFEECLNHVFFFPVGAYFRCFCWKI